MDHAQILALIAALSGTPEKDPFATLKAEAAKPGAMVSLEACPRPYPAGEIEGLTLICGHVKVPEDSAKPDGKMLPLAFGIFKTTSLFPEPDPLVYLHGGPSGKVFDIMHKVRDGFVLWRDRRDIVFYDQRSAGLSGGSVQCAKALTQNVVEIARPGSKANVYGIPAPELMQACVTELEKQGVPLPLYNTTQNALDVPLVAKAWGNYLVPLSIQNVGAAAATFSVRSGRRCCSSRGRRHCTRAYIHARCTAVCWLCQ